ncbi:hypothetical protein EC957_004630 [Mortierella hygrophila]|uniref:Uncharacterized protein n=1 Tax=Mortierella hygrophila TaxID=979708 RepID=A0A9P6F1B4_9FUNG|nr:hypothetical protein EC957_004630 [Mortierella hygrophila]
MDNYYRHNTRGQTLDHLIVLVLGFIFILASKDESTISDRRIDYLGIFLFCAGIVCIILYLTVSTASGWVSAKTLAPFIVSLVLLIAFVFLEYKIDYPIMPSTSGVLSVWSLPCLIIVYDSAGLSAMFYFS